MRVHTPVQKFKEAQILAREYGLKISDKSGVFRVFRDMGYRVVFQGERSSVDGLHKLVCKLTRFN